MSIEAVRDLVEAAPKFVLPLRDGPDMAQQDEPHPLTRFVELDGQPAPPKMVIPGFVQAGVVIVSGQQGVGKTTVLVPLAMVAAGLHARDDPLAPRHWRHVVYVSEDVPQVQRIVAGVVGHAGIGLDMAVVRERFHVVPALRMPAEEVAAAGPMYREGFTRTVGGVELPPLVVVDTRSATIDAADENDNAEAGRIVALFKQRFTGLPLWLRGSFACARVARLAQPRVCARCCTVPAGTGWTDTAARTFLTARFRRCGWWSSRFGILLAAHLSDCAARVRSAQAA